MTHLVRMIPQPHSAPQRTLKIWNIPTFGKCQTLRGLAHLRNNSNGWQIAFVTTTASAPRFPADKSYRRGESAFARTTIMYCVKGVNQNLLSEAKAAAVRTPVRTSTCKSFVLWIVSGGVPARRQGPSGRPCRIRAGRRVAHHLSDVCALGDSTFGRCPYMTSACLSAQSCALL